MSIFALSLHKISCTRQSVSKLTLRSFALSLHKVSCTRQSVSKLTLRSFALSLQKPIIITYMKKTTKAILAITILVISATVGASLYMLDYSLSPDHNRKDLDSVYTLLYRRMPDMKPWVDSMKTNGFLRDTFLIMPTGERQHALYIRADSAKGRSVVLVHGYKDCSVKFLYLGRMYNRDLKYNVVIPDLHAHGLSDGNDIQMGWKDRLDIKRWVEMAAETFADSAYKTDIVVHGVSMGAATTMCLSGEELPEYVTHFIEDCGYTSAWDEFAVQLKEQFALPQFPLMYTTSLLCRIVHGWSFGEASPIKQVSKCRRPMLFIHGDADDFVPYYMMQQLYDAKKYGKKELWTTKGTQHACSYIDYPKEYTYKVKMFLRK